MNIYQKLIEVRKEVPYLQKESKGAQYAYVGSSQVLANIRNKMDELQLLLIPAVTAHNVRESTVEQFSKEDNLHPFKRTTTYFTELEMTMTWVNAEKPEETIVCPWYGQGVDIAGEKGVGKALTYAEKYFILKQFNIPTDKDDPDAFQGKHETKEKTPIPLPTQPAKTQTGDEQLDALLNGSIQNNLTKLNELQPQLGLKTEGEFIVKINAWIDRAAKASKGAFEPFEITALSELSKVDGPIVSKLIESLTKTAIQMRVGAK